MKLQDYLEGITTATTAGELRELRALAESDLELSDRAKLRVEREVAAKFEARKKGGTK